MQRKYIRNEYQDNDSLVGSIVVTDKVDTVEIMVVESPVGDKDDTVEVGTPKSPLPNNCFKVTVDVRGKGGSDPETTVILSGKVPETLLLPSLPIVDKSKHKGTENGNPYDTTLSDTEISHEGNDGNNDQQTPTQGRVTTSNDIVMFYYKEDSKHFVLRPKRDVLVF